MPNHPKPEKKKSSPSSDDIQVPAIPKQTAGAVTGAAIGSIAGPTGAVVGGVIGALVGKSAADRGQFGRLLDEPQQSRKGHSHDIQEKSPCRSRAKRAAGGHASRLRKGRDLADRTQQDRAGELYARRAN